jgi:hypothetical protein
VSRPGSHRIDEDSLYDLLPAIHRVRDAELGKPLQALLRAIARQSDGLAGQIARQYDDWFVETCDDELVPYFADLVALALGSPAGGHADGTLAAIDATWRRRQVADALLDRRRKGSFSVLEQLAFDATGWPARAIELSGRALATQSVRLADVRRRPLVDLGDGNAVTVLGTPFSSAARNVDVRRLSSARTPGYVYPAGVAVWLWRLVAETVNRQPAASVGESNHYTFDPLGRDLQLCVAPTPRRAGTVPAGLLDVPAAIDRHSMAYRLEDYYGPGRSIRVYRGSKLVPRSHVLIGDLGGWRHATPAGHVTIDPVRGRLTLSARHPPEEGVWVSYPYLTVGAIGGGGYGRGLIRDVSGPAIYRVTRGGGVGAFRKLGAALAQWAQDKRAGKSAGHAVIEIGDDDVYAEHLRIRLAAGDRLEIRAAPRCRPVIVPLEQRTNRPDALRVRGVLKPRSPKERGADAAEPVLPELVLDGVWVAGAPLELAGELSTVSLRHCTLVPAVGTIELESPDDRHDPSLVVTASPGAVAISSSVIGRIRVESAEAGHDPIPISATDSILDASELHGDVLDGADRRRAYVSLSLLRTTVLGRARVREVGNVRDSLLGGPLECERRQVGEVSFSYVAPGSRTPRRISCQPDGVVSEVDELVVHGKLPRHERERAREAEIARVAPVFDSTRFGDPAYGRLTEAAPEELGRGAHDEGELGAYHDQWQRLRAQDLRRRLQEFAPAGSDIDILFAT